MLIGHDPGPQRLALELIQPASAVRELEAKYPPQDSRPGVGPPKAGVSSTAVQRRLGASCGLDLEA